MKKISSCCLLFFSIHSFATSNEQMETCVHWPSVLRPFCQRIHQVWTNGATNLYLSGSPWHNQYTYAPARIKTFNEAAYGTGFGKGLFDEKGNWRGLYVIAFLDSHRNIEPAAGYAFLKVAT